MRNAQNQGICDSLYADDTLLVAKDADTMHVLLKATQTDSTYYNMTLNMGKCLTITLNGIAHTHFQDGTLLSNVPDAKCLGVSLNEGASNKPDLAARFVATLAMVTASKTYG